MRRGVLALVVCCGFALTSFGCSGCGEDPPTEDDTGDTTTVDATDAVDSDEADTEGDTETDADEDDTSSDADAGPSTCDFLGKTAGVCSDGVPGGDLPDGGLGDVGSADAGGDCGPPPEWEADESTLDDGLDNDCDGVTDEGASCDYLDRTEGVCGGGGTISPNDGSCEAPDDYEQDETTCDGKDNDCDGVTGEGCVCNYNNTNTGVCSGGTKNEQGDCEAPGNYEMPESSCDGLDNDCDGQTDDNDSDLSCSCVDGNTQKCYTGQPSGTAGTGICKRGTQTCNNGTWGSCANEVTPKQNEDCSNQKDDDCDGVTNEGCSCNFDGTSTGVCGSGTIDSNGNCTAPTDYESDETQCDNKDNDCDGVTDENCPCAYNGTNTGICGTATIDPSSGNCAEPADYESTESSCDSKDNDCDGQTDDADSDLSCSCTAGNTRSCYTGPSGTAGVGVCSAGTQTCQSDGTWGSCMNEVTPSSETCDDSKDNDCDGTTDEGCPCNYKGKNAGVCQNQTINSNGNCSTPKEYETPEATCSDGLDNDCDGNADCADSDCSGKQCGLSGSQCSGGQCVETACQDGKDNDGDGDIDCLDSDCTYCGSGAYCDSSGICHETNCLQSSGDEDNDGNPNCADSDCDQVKCGSTATQTRYCCSGSMNCSITCGP